MPDQRPFRLLDLPSEIRNEIYRCILCTWDPPKPHSEDLPAHIVPPGLEALTLSYGTAILRTCRQVHREAYDVMVKTNRFIRITQEKINVLQLLKDGNQKVVTVDSDKAVAFQGCVMSVDFTADHSFRTISKEEKQAWKEICHLKGYELGDDVMEDMEATDDLDMADMIQLAIDRQILRQGGELNLDDHHEQDMGGNHRSEADMIHVAIDRQTLRQGGELNLDDHHEQDVSGNHGSEVIDEAEPGLLMHGDDDPDEDDLDQDDYEEDDSDKDDSDEDESDEDDWNDPNAWRDEEQELSEKWNLDLYEYKAECIREAKNTVKVSLSGRRESDYRSSFLVLGRDWDSLCATLKVQLGLWHGNESGLKIIVRMNAFPADLPDYKAPILPWFTKENQAKILGAFTQLRFYPRVSLTGTIDSELAESIPRVIAGRRWPAPQDFHAAIHSMVEKARAACSSHCLDAGDVCLRTMKFLFSVFESSESIFVLMEGGPKFTNAVTKLFFAFQLHHAKCLTDTMQYITDNRSMKEGCSKELEILGHEFDGFCIPKALDYFHVFDVQRSWFYVPSPAQDGKLHFLDAIGSRLWGETMTQQDCRDKLMLVPGAIKSIKIAAELLPNDPQILAEKSRIHAWASKAELILNEEKRRMEQPGYVRTER